MRFPPSARLRAALGLFLAVGAIVRIVQFAARRPLWLDEAMLAINIASRRFTNLLDPLDYGQTAPPLFLLAEHAMVRLFGVNEWSLRALPLAAGLVLVPVLWRAARHFGSEEGAVIATGLVAVSPVLTYYSNEVKPYGLDALATLLLTMVAVWVLERPDERRRWVMLQVAGALAVWVSTPAMFVLGGIGLALVASSTVRASVGWWKRLAATAAVWGASFAVVFFAVLRHSANNPFLQRYFERAFLTLDSPDLLAILQTSVGGMLSGSFFHRDLFEATVPTARIAFVAVALLLSGVGLLTIARSHGAAALVLVSPLLAAMAASAVRMYPFTARLLVFATPLLAISAAGGMVAVAYRLPARARRGVLSAGAALFLLPGAYHALEEARDPYTGYEHSRPVVLALTRGSDAGDPVYVFAPGIPQWVFYTTDWEAPDSARLTFYAAVSAPPGGPSLQNAPSRGRPVSHEGFGLWYDYRGRREVPALASGVERRPGFEGAPSTPDAGWADNEAARIRLAASPCIWVLAIANAAGEVPELLKAIAALGGEKVKVRRDWGHSAIRVCFPA